MCDRGVKSLCAAFSPSHRYITIMSLFLSRALSLSSSLFLSLPLSLSIPEYVFTSTLTEPEVGPAWPQTRCASHRVQISTWPRAHAGSGPCARGLSAAVLPVQPLWCGRGACVLNKKSVVKRRGVETVDWVISKPKPCPQALQRVRLYPRPDCQA
jgi:hypothetical protein